MWKKWAVVFFITAILIILYIIQISKIDSSAEYGTGTLDELNTDDIAKAWEPFYRVRATIIDSHSARFNIPDELLSQDNKEIELTGAAVFIGSNCTREGDQITISDFSIVPSLAIAESCVIPPDLEMRWTIKVTLKEKWTVHYEDMISMMVKVKGLFRIDTSDPYEAAFYIDNAVAEVVEDN